MSSFGPITRLAISPTTMTTMGAKFFQKCMVCFLLTAILLLVYIALRFKKIGGLSAGLTAIVALLHDIIIAFCIFVIFGMAINDIFIAVVLTLLGYSLNSRHLGLLVRGQALVPGKGDCDAVLAGGDVLIDGH